MSFLKNLFSKQPRQKLVDIKKRFELLGRVGQGSMSKVWRARDSMSGKTVALKVLDKVKTERLEQRFVGMNRPSEGEISISLKHPNIVHTLEHGLTTDHEQFLVMEFVEGVALSFLVERQNDRMKKNCLWYAIQLGEGLDHLHRKQFIHRDLCPRNIMVSDQDVVKLMDFGLVVPNTPPFRAPGNRTGTACYMAPELIKRQHTDERIDIFSYSVTVFEMFTKQLPWKSNRTDSLETVMQFINTPPRDLSELRPDLDPRIGEVLKKGLAADPKERWSSIRKMVDELEAIGRDLKLIPTG